MRLLDTNGGNLKLKKPPSMPGGITGWHHQTIPGPDTVPGKQGRRLYDGLPKIGGPGCVF